jgi:hypothetical protein
MDLTAQKEKAHLNRMKCAFLLLCQQRADLIVGNMADPRFPFFWHCLEQNCPADFKGLESMFALWRAGHLA